MAVELKGSPDEKLRIIRDLTVKYARSTFTKKLLAAIAPRDWRDIFWWVKNNLRYRREKPGKDVLLEPPETIGRIYADCEDYTTLLGSLLLAAGYPVRLKLISNATYHIYPEIGLPPSNPVKWIGLDATTGLIGDKIYPPYYHPYKEVEIQGISGISEGKAMEKTIEISMDTPLNPGDRIRFIYKALPYVPDYVERFFYEKLVSIRHPNFKILRVFKNEKENEWVVEVEVLPPEKIQQASALTAAIIASAFAIGAVASYFTLKRVEKVVEVGKTPLTFWTLAMVLGGVAAVLSEWRKKK